MEYILKHLYKIFLIITAVVLFNTCNTTEPPSDQTLTLKLEDVSCTEAWIQLTTTNLQLPVTINLLKNNSLAHSFVLNTQDSLLYIDSLLPNQDYSFQVSSIEYPVSPGGTGSISSNKLTVTTMDTTSHNFTWQTFTFGQHSSSVLYDVAIINENNIWAVGEIYMNDSLGNPDPSLYNLIKWNGTQWKPERVYFKNSQGQSFLAPMKSIFAFNANDVWIGLDQIIHWNGITYKSIELPDAVFQSWINKIWGSSSNDLYAVGNNGNIAHYQNGSWTKIESGTTTNINDAWGVFENGTSTVFCPVSSIFNPPQDKKILKIVDGKVYSVSWNKDRILYSCWTNSNNFLYACGEGVFVNKFGTWEQITLPAITTNSIRGNDINNIFAVGSLGTIFHFNGISWQVISIYTSKENYRVAIKNNVVAICGYYNGKGFVEIGRRN